MLRPGKSTQTGSSLPLTGSCCACSVFRLQRGFVYREVTVTRFSIVTELVEDGGPCNASPTFDFWIYAFERNGTFSGNRI